MDRQEQFRRNLKHAAEFLEGLLDHPEELERLPDRANVVSMPADDPQLCAANNEMMQATRARARSPHRDPRPGVLDDSTLLVNI